MSVVPLAMFKNETKNKVNIQKINLINLLLYHLIVMGSIFRLFVFWFVLSCAFHLHNVRGRNTKLQMKKEKHVLYSSLLQNGLAPVFSMV